MVNGSYTTVNVTYTTINTNGVSRCIDCNVTCSNNLQNSCPYKEEHFSTTVSTPTTWEEPTLDVEFEKLVKCKYPKVELKLPKPQPAKINQRVAFMMHITRIQ